jgi:hypothetical protein
MSQRCQQPTTRNGSSACDAAVSPSAFATCSFLARFNFIERTYKAMGEDSRIDPSQYLLNFSSPPRSSVIFSKNYEFEKKKTAYFARGGGLPRSNLPPALRLSAYRGKPEVVGARTLRTTGKQRGGHKGHLFIFKPT